MDNLEQQRDEIQVLSSIYGEEFILEEFTTEYQVYSMEFVNDSKSVEVKVTAKLPATYPLLSPPIFEVSSPYLNGKAKLALSHKLEAISSEGIGEPVLYQCFEEVRQFITTFTVESKNEPDNIKNEINETTISKIISSPAATSTMGEKKSIIFSTGAPIIDRKSTFQGHVAQVFNRDDVLSAMQQLKLNTKIERATHNMYAYRINDGNVWLQDCDDDGESQAGSRLLHLLQVIEAKNVLVVVSRWYGGVHLGSARFKHINNAARQVLEEHGYIAAVKSKKM